MDHQLVSSFAELLQRSRRVAILLRQYPSVDAAAAALGWQLLLEAAGHEVHVVASGGLPAHAAFLPGAGGVRTSLPPTPLTVTLKTGEVAVGKVRYETTDGELKVHVTPAAGSLDPGAVSATNGERPFDLAISIGCPRREDWGPVFDGSRELLMRCPTVAVDTHPGHQRYGQLNLLDVASPSLCVASHSVWSTHRPDMSWLTPEVATCWYAGTVVATDRFASPRVTPATLAAAGQMLAAGADRDGAMANLFKRRTVGEVRLWGAALSSLEWDEASRLTWCSITRGDVVSSGAGDADVSHLILEVSAASPLADVAILFYERSPEETEVTAAAPGSIDAPSLLRQFQPTGDSDLATATVPLGLPACRDRILEAVRVALAAARGSSTVPTPAGP